jgi:protein involved in polysaccharide export with SLBB domain
LGDVEVSLFINNSTKFRAKSLYRKLSKRGRETNTIMKKLTSAALLLIGTLGLSAAGQAKSGVTGNTHPKSMNADAPATEPVGVVRVLAQNSASGQEGIDSALHSDFTTKANLSETTEAANSRSRGDVAVDKAVVSLHATNTSSTSDSAIPSVPGAAATVSPTEIYRVGIGDVLDVQLPQTPGNRSSLFTVLEGGVLDYPFIRNPIAVAGLTTDEIAARLRQEIKIFDKLDFVVAVRDYASHNVTVTGLVTAPGIKRLRREAVPLYVVISQSLPLGEATRATIVRTGTQPMTVDLSDSKASSTLVIPGDVIRVTVAPGGPMEFFFAGGEVAAPGQKPYHSGLTLTQAILASGGITKTAGTKVIISRQAANGHLVRTQYDLRKIQSGKAPDPVLLKDDRLEMNAR